VPSVGRAAPDGTWVAATGFSETGYGVLFTVDLATGAGQVLDDAIGGPIATSNDGRWVFVYNRERLAIRAYDRETGTRRDLPGLGVPVDDLIATPLPS
jgi:hypothetical protein